MPVPHEPTFQNYPASAAQATTESGPNDWVIVTSVGTSSPQSIDSGWTSPPMTEGQALATIEAVCRGAARGLVTVDERCVVIQISPREVIVRRTNMFSTFSTRVEIGRVRIRPRNATT